eukprot:4735433-Amphidinium_carterae.1
MAVDPCNRDELDCHALVTKVAHTQGQNEQTIAHPEGSNTSEFPQTGNPEWEKTARDNNVRNDPI